MDRSLNAGVFGFLLALVINLFSPIYLYFMPSFFAAIVATYVFRLREIKDGLVTTFMTYIFNDGFLGTISLAAFYWANEPYPSISLDIWTVFSPIVAAVSALIAGYIGVRLAQKREPARELPAPMPPQLPPV